VISAKSIFLRSEGHKGIWVFAGQATNPDPLTRGTFCLRSMGLRVRVEESPLIFALYMLIFLSAGEAQTPRWQPVAAALTAEEIIDAAEAAMGPEDARASIVFRRSCHENGGSAHEKSMTYERLLFSCYVMRRRTMTRRS
jgi:hypothetical protein